MVSLSSEYQIWLGHIILFCIYEISNESQGYDKKFGMWTRFFWCNHLLAFMLARNDHNRDSQGNLSFVFAKAKLVDRSRFLLYIHGKITMFMKGWPSQVP